MSTLHEIQTAIEHLTARERVQLERWFYTRVFPKDDVNGQIEGDGRIEEPPARYAARPVSELISYEEYLELEKHGDVRHEYVAGVLFAMSGASRNHNRIAGNLFKAISSHVGKGPCEVFMADFNVRLERQDAGYYPDVMVACDREKKDLYTMEPRLIVEVLSPATRQKDEREKLLSYRSLDTLQEYVLVEQDCPEAIIYRRGLPWQRLEIRGLNEVLEFKSIGLTIAMQDMLEGTAMAAQE